MSRVRVYGQASTLQNVCTTENRNDKQVMIRTNNATTNEIMQCTSRVAVSRVPG